MERNFIMDAKKLKNDIIIYILLLIACAALFFWLTPQEVVLRANTLNSNFTPRTFPNLLTIGVAISAAIGLVSTCLKYGKARHAVVKEEKKKRTKHEWMTLLAPYITFAVLIVYCALFENLGYIVSSLLLVPTLLLLFGSRKWSHAAIVYGFAALMFVLFKYVLLVPLR